MKTHVHDNSKAVYWSPETQSAFTARERLILDALSQMGSATHRQLQQFLDFTDLGMCQPRCSDLVRKGAIEECGRVRCDAAPRMPPRAGRCAMNAAQAGSHPPGRLFAMKTKTLFTLSIAGLLALTGCAKFHNEIAADGGILGSYAGDYIVRNDSGGKIMDVWVLRNVMVQPVGSGAGWLFLDQGGNPIHLGGDLKVVRVNDAVTLARYHEYHTEFETKSYQELYAKAP